MMDTNFILSTLAVMITIAAMGFLAATPLMKKYYNQKLQAETEANQNRVILSLKIQKLRNKLNKKKKK